jgi:hypothetical protein
MANDEPTDDGAVLFRRKRVPRGLARPATAAAVEAAEADRAGSRESGSDDEHVRCVAMCRLFPVLPSRCIPSSVLEETKEAQRFRKRNTGIRFVPHCCL